MQTRRLASLTGPLQSYHIRVGVVSRGLGCTTDSLGIRGSRTSNPARRDRHYWRSRQHAQPDTSLAVRESDVNAPCTLSTRSDRADASSRARANVLCFCEGIRWHTIARTTLSGRSVVISASVFHLAALGEEASRYVVAARCGSRGRCPDGRGDCVSPPCGTVGCAPHSSKEGSCLALRPVACPRRLAASEAYG